MRKLLFFIIVSALTLTSSLLATEVTDVELSFHDGFTQAKIIVDGRASFKHETAEAGGGKPFRVFVDVFSAVNKLPQREYMELPESPITHFRNSQYTSNPDPVVRLVFDMRRPSIYRVEQGDGYISLFFADNAGKGFPTWFASGKTPQQASEEPQVKAPQPKSVAQANNKIQKDRRESLKASKAASGNTAARSSGETYGPSLDPKLAVALTPTPKTKSAPAKAKKTVAKKSESSIKTDKQINASTLKSSKTVASKTSTTAKPKAEQKSQRPVTSTPRLANVSGDKSPNKAPAQTTPKASKTSTAAQQPTLAKTEADTKKSAAKPTMKKQAASPTAEKPAPAKSTPPKAKQEPAKKPVFANTVTSFRSEGPWSVGLSDIQPEPKATKKPAKAQDTKLMAKADDNESPRKKPASTKKTDSKPSTLEKHPKDGKAKTEPAKAEPKKQDRPSRKTSRFRRSPVLSKKLEGTLVAEFPKRLTVKYRSMARRDPFETLINEEKVHNLPVEQRVANVEGLKLVGIIESGAAGNRALFEDTDGYGYILKTGDKVQKGYVLRVESNRVYFQIFEYGWSRTVALNLEEY